MGNIKKIYIELVQLHLISIVYYKYSGRSQKCTSVQKCTRGKKCTSAQKCTKIKLHEDKTA